MSIDVNRSYSYRASISFQDSQGDSLYAKENPLNKQTSQGAQIAILGEPKLGQTALMVAQRGIIGIPNLEALPMLGEPETHPSGSAAASPAKPKALRSFAQLQPEIERLIKGYADEMDRHNDNQFDPDGIYLLKQNLRSKIHSLLAIPQSQRTNISLKYSDANGQPFRYGELDRVIFDGIAKILRELENNPSQDIEVAEEAGWLHQLLLRKNTVRFTTSLANTQKLLRSIERLRSKLTESWVEVERLPSGIARSKRWNNSEIKDRLGDIQAGVATIMEWLTADNEGRNRMLQMPKAHRRGVSFFQSLTSKDVMQDQSTCVSQLPEGMAAIRKLSNGQTDINVSSNYLQSHSSDIVAGAIVHELGHVLEYQNPTILEKSIAFSSQIKLLAKDLGYKDFLYKDSQGKAYASEVLAVAVGRIYHDPVEFFKEYPNWFGFVIDILRGVGISKPDVSKQDHPGLIRCFEVAS